MSSIVPWGKFGAPASEVCYAEACYNRRMYTKLAGLIAYIFMIRSNWCFNPSFSSELEGLGGWRVSSQVWCHGISQALSIPAWSSRSSNNLYIGSNQVTEISSIQHQNQDKHTRVVDSSWEAPRPRGFLVVHGPPVPPDDIQPQTLGSPPLTILAVIAHTSASIWTYNKLISVSPDTTCLTYYTRPYVCVQWVWNRKQRIRLIEQFQMIWLPMINGPRNPSWLPFRVFFIRPSFHLANYLLFWQTLVKVKLGLSRPPLHSILLLKAVLQRFAVSWVLLIVMRTSKSKTK